MADATDEPMVTLRDVIWAAEAVPLKAKRTVARVNIKALNLYEKRFNTILTPRDLSISIV